MIKFKSSNKYINIQPNLKWLKPNLKTSDFPQGFMSLHDYFLLF